MDAAFDAFDFRTAITSAWELVTLANRYIDDEKPWEIAKAAKNGDEAADARLDVVLANLVETLRLLGVFLAPFVPLGAERIANQLAFSLEDGGAKTVREWTDALAGEELPKAKPVFPRIEVETGEAAEVPA
jgi:methionyl-tRNA synthetase